MKNLILLIGLIFGFKLIYACNYIKGNASLIKIEGTNNYVLKCIGDGLCAKIHDDGNTIDVYTGNGKITGTIMGITGMNHNSNDTCTVDEIVLNVVN